MKSFKWGLEMIKVIENKIINFTRLYTSGIIWLMVNYSGS